MVQHFSLIDDDEDIGPRALAPVIDGEALEDQQKTKIHIVYQGQRIPVSWFSDTKPSDIRLAIECACDCVKPGSSFELIELFPKLEYVEMTERILSSSNITMSDYELSLFEKGRAIAFNELHKLSHSWAYLLQQGLEQWTKDNRINPDRCIRVQIHPLMHKEVEKGIKRMKKGSNLLKHTTNGNPHLRYFQLSKDCKRLIWYTSNKSKSKSVIHINEMDELIVGQLTPSFQFCPIQLLEHLSFSIAYKNKSKFLDLTCNDEEEFDAWLCGLKGLIHYYRREKISKIALLSHSKKFQILSEKYYDSNIILETMKNDKIKMSKTTLFDLIDVPKLSLDEIKEKIKTNEEKIIEISDRTELILAKFISNGNTYDEKFLETDDNQLFKNIYEDNDYFDNTINNEDDMYNDEVLEVHLLASLVNQSNNLLTELKKLYLSYIRKDKKKIEKESPSVLLDLEDISPNNSTNVIKDKMSSVKIRSLLEEKLWRLDVDLENLEDILARNENNFENIVNSLIPDFTLNDVSVAVDNSIKSIKNFFGNLLKDSDDSDTEGEQSQDTSLRYQRKSIPSSPHKNIKYSQKKNTRLSANNSPTKLTSENFDKRKKN